MIRRCAVAGCPYLVRWHAFCPLHRPPTSPGALSLATRRASTTAAPKENRP